MERLYKASVSDWEIEFENGDAHKFDIVFEEKIIFHNEYEIMTIDIVEGTYLDIDTLNKIRKEPIKSLKQSFTLCESDGKMSNFDQESKTHKNVVLKRIVINSKPDGIDMITFKFQKNI